MNRKLMFIIIIVINTGTLNAQLNKVELFDLIKNLLPDVNQVQGSVTWSKVEATKDIRWKNPKPAIYKNGNAGKYGTSNIVINGKSFPCGGKKNACDWHVSLNGNAQGFSKIDISPDLSFDSPYLTSLTYLFNKHTYKSKTLRKCNSHQETLYEVEIPGKNVFWMNCFKDGGSGGDAIYIECYFNKNDLSNKCTFEW